MNDYLSKPFNKKELAQLLEHWLPQLEKEETMESSSEFVPEVESGILDAGALDEIRALQRSGEPGLLSRVLGRYIGETSKLIRNLKDAADRDDIGAIHGMAHNLKSSSALVGAHRMAELCGTLELDSRDGKPEDLPARIADLAAAFNQARAALEELIEGKRPAR
jgi:HPt (histidine-containing phosphotransfer) domain-containing protein